MLWSQGNPQYRFDPTIAAEMRDQIDAQLQAKWQEQFGHLTPEEKDSLTWRKLNFGKPLAHGVDPMAASNILWSIGTDFLKSHPADMFKCFAVQGSLMLIFPLGLVLWPPASSGSASFSMLMGNQGPRAALVSTVIGSAYAILALWIIANLIMAVARRRFPAGYFAFWPAAAMFIFSLPFEDPRFRLPLIPLFLILARPQPLGAESTLMSSRMN
jgi:hypothetical protein